MIQSRQSRYRMARRRRVEQGHQSADDQQLAMRPREQIGQRVAPAGEHHRDAGHGQLACNSGPGREWLIGELLVTNPVVSSGSLRKIAIDQEPPARRFRELFPPALGSGAFGIRNGCSSSSNSKRCANESRLNPSVSSVCWSAWRLVEINRAQLFPISLHPCRRGDERRRRGKSFDLARRPVTRLQCAEIFCQSSCNFAASGARTIASTGSQRVGILRMIA